MARILAGRADQKIINFLACVDLASRPEPRSAMFISRDVVRHDALFMRESSRRSFRSRGTDAASFAVKSSGTFWEAGGLGGRKRERDEEEGNARRLYPYN